MNAILQVFYAVFSGLVLSCAIPNEFITFGSPFLGLFSLVPLYFAIANAKSYKEAGFLCAIQTALTHVISSYWLVNFKDFAIFTLGASSLAYAFSGFLLGNYLYGVLRKPKDYQLFENAGTKPFRVVQRILVFALLWTMAEWKKSTGFLAYPWGTILMTAYDWNFITQIADITGTWGISFLFALFNAVIAEGLCRIPEIPHFSTNKSQRAYSFVAAATIVLFACSSLYGVFRIVSFSKKQPEKFVSTLIVQQNINSWFDNDPASTIEMCETLTEEGIKRAEYRPDVVIWSESIISRPMPSATRYYTSFPLANPLIPFIKNTEIPFVIGGTTKSKNPHQDGYSNSALYFNDNGRYVGSYSKIQLVPFAESIPYANSQFVKTVLDTLVGFSNGWVPGTEYKVFSLPLQNQDTINFSAPICFEDAFSDVCRNLFLQGSDIFFNLTNDSWSQTASAEIQHFVIASYRTIENRIPMVRCTNSGYSAVINPLGQTIFSLPLFISSSEVAKIPLYEREITVYSRLGDWLPKLCYILVILYFFSEAIMLMKKQKIVLFENEDKILKIKKDKKTLKKYYLFTIICLVLCLCTTNHGVFKTTITCCLLFSLFLLLYGLQQYKTVYWLVTSKRLLIMKGFLEEKITHIPLKEIAYFTLEKNKRIVLFLRSGKKILLPSNNKKNVFKILSQICSQEKV